MGHDWSFWIDVGGTFTDCLARGPDGVIRAHKLLSSGVYPGVVGPGSTARIIVDPQRRGAPPAFFEGRAPDGTRYRLTLRRAARRRGRLHTEALDANVEIGRFDHNTGSLELARPLKAEPTEGMLYTLASGEAAPIVGIRWLKGKRVDEPIGEASIRLGTTRGTNALLERQGARTAFVTTRGFGDVLRIGEQDRPKLFDLHIRKPSDLYEQVVEVTERLDASGQIRIPLDEAEVRAKLTVLRDAGITSLAVCLLHAYRNGEHERRIEQVALALGFEHVSVSSRLAPAQRIVPRGDTTVVDAYLTPIIRRYVSGLRAKVPEATVKVMTSAGGLVDAEAFVGKDSILSGPAGGVVGCAHVSRLAGFDRAIGFDMGGTSTDVSRFDGAFERRFEMAFNDPESDTGVRVVAPMLAIETVAAGGGSICWFDGVLPRVGPRSAGAEPGPACYGRGGPLTVTDVNLYLGKILPEHFAFPLDREAVIERVDESIHQMAAAGQTYTREELAAGFTRIANANMASAIKKISLARGYDPRDHCLTTFGGAGPQHACAIARELGIRTVLLHPFGGVLSAFGMGVADVKKFAEHPVGRRYDAPALAGLEPIFRSLEAELQAAVLAEGIEPQNIRPPHRQLDLRYEGMAHAVTVTRAEDGDYLAGFRNQFRKRFGFLRDLPIEIAAARVEVVGETAKPEPVRQPTRDRTPEPESITQTYFDGGYRDTRVHHRDVLRPGDRIDGPAILLESIATVVVEPGWQAVVNELGDLVLTDRLGATKHEAVSTGVDLITLELFNNQFASIATQMGTALQKTALSTNVKERLDFSCAIFTAAGELVANAPHIPVHLGAMSECVQRLIADVPDMKAGEVYVTNDPFRGGSHLPDVTVVTPVFDAAGTAVLFFTASRAHHAEIGGITPGSMPPFAKNLSEEGVLIRAMRLVADAQTREAPLRALLSGGAYPSRSVDENIADINAQVAANQVGVTQLLAMVDRYGLDVVGAYMGHIQRAAESHVRRALLTLEPGAHRYRDCLDNGAEICVTVTIRHTARGGEAVVDFTGTAGVLEGNLNANRAIVRSAVIYCFRCLIDKDIPLNAGVLAPLRIVLPTGCLLNPPEHEDPTQCAAVGGGNVETSQRIVDVIFGALGVVAASQGTMNNVLFGRAADANGPGFAYYETIGGGAGAGPTFDGAHAVHTHMTNTRMTDPEVFEARYPVRLNRLAIRHGSGGPGAHRGGDGIVREMEFLMPVELSLLTGRRERAPYGVAGGSDGQPGKNGLRRHGRHHTETLPAAATRRIAAGDVLLIETPGGGGYGCVPLRGDQRVRPGEACG